MKLTTITTIACALGLAATAALAQTAALTNTPPKPTAWSVSASAGLTLTRGNSKTVLGTANVTGSKKWERNDVNLGVQGIYGENDGTKNADSVRGVGQYNRLFPERLLAYMRLEALHDAIADIDYRFIVSPGAGYYFLKAPRTSLNGEVGPGYIYEHDGDGITHSYISLRLADRFEHKFNDHAKIWQTAEVLPQVNKFSNYIINAEVGIETIMTKKLSLLTYLQDSYHSVPAPGRVRNDLKLVSAIKYTF